MPGIYPPPPAPGPYRVVASIGRGKDKRVEKAFPKGTTPRAMALWQEQARAELRARAQLAPKAGSLEADVSLYMAARATMPTAIERRRHLELWTRLLGLQRHRDTVTPHEVRALLQGWQAAGSSPGTCNRRRTALQAFYTVLNGKTGYNPVREVPKAHEPEQPPRRLDYATLDAILAVMPDRGQRLAGASPKAISQTKARLRVIAYTGLPHALVAQIRPEHFLPAERILFVKGRHKGAGTGDRWHPLSTKGVEAVAGLLAAKATGPFSRSSMHKSFLRAATKVGRPDLRPYDLRHLFGQQVLRSSGNRAVTRDLMLHRSDKTTARYVAAEIPAELRAALRAFDKAVSE
jgi:integrase